MNSLTKSLSAQKALTIQSSNAFKLNTKSLPEEYQKRFIYGWKKMEAI